jgi:hypothetical protein
VTNGVIEVEWGGGAIRRPFLFDLSLARRTEAPSASVKVTTEPTGPAAPIGRITRR